MASAYQFREIALNMPEVTEEPHFGKTSFRVAKKIFATMYPDGSLAMVKLSVLEQGLFCPSGSAVIYPVPNKWGQSGATYVALAAVSIEILTELLTSAYKGVAPKKLGDLVAFR